MKKILIIGTLDSKGREIDYLRNRIEEKGLSPLVLDTGTLGEPLCHADYTQEEVARAGGEDLLTMKSKRDRSYSIATMTRGAINKALEIYSQKQLAGVISIGGGTGTAIGTAVMRSLPMGIPKVMVSTVASRNVQPYVGTSDIMMFHSVVDMAGLNTITKNILDRAADAITGMAKGTTEIIPNRFSIAVTSYGISPRCAELAESFLGEKGYEMVTFHANGIGGRALEQLIGQGLFTGVLDFVSHELMDQLYNGYCGDIGPDRLATAARKGIPIIIAPGGLDNIVFSSIEEVPLELKQRRIYRHDIRVAVRTSEKELEIIAKTLAERLANPNGPVGILIPLKGWSEADKEGSLLYDPNLNNFFIDTLESMLPDGVSLKKAELHISDPDFANKAVEWLHEMITDLNHKHNGGFLFPPVDPPPLWGRT